MKKTLYTRENQIFCGLLKVLRNEANLTQEEVANRLEWPQTYVSRYERGDRRLDPVELYSVCNALEIPFMEFARRWEEAIDQNRDHQPLRY